MYIHTYIHTYIVATICDHWMLTPMFAINITTGKFDSSYSNHFTRKKKGNMVKDLQNSYTSQFVYPWARSLVI